METIYLIQTTFWGRDLKIEAAYKDKEQAWKFYSDYCYYQTPYLRPDGGENEMFYGACKKGKISNRIFFEKKEVPCFEDFIKENNIINNDFRSHVILMG